MTAQPAASATLQDALVAAARSQAAVHYIGSDGAETRVTYAQLLRRAQGMVGFLQRRGMQAGDELVLLVDDLEAFVDTFWACVLGRIAVVPLAASASDEQRLKTLRVLGKLKRPYILADRKVLAKLSAVASANDFAVLTQLPRERAISLDEVTDLDHPGAPVAAAPDDIAFIQFSSGSTGAPKGVVLTHRNLVTNIAAIVAGIGGTRANDASLSWMPLTHDMGLIGFHLVPVTAAASHWLMTPAQFVRRPHAWLQKTSQHRISVTCSPNFGYKHLLKGFDATQCAGLDLSSVRVVFNGAEPIAAGLCRDFVQAFAPHGLRKDVMLPVYGLAEASLAVTFPPNMRPLSTVKLSRDSLGPGDPVRAMPADDATAIEYVKVGSPVAGCSLRIADPHGNALADGLVGRIFISGDNVTRGYYGDDPLTAATIDASGWLDTGDLGVMVDGELVVTGRAKDLVFVAGLNHYPQDLEALLARHGGVESGRAAVVGVRAADDVTDDVVVFVVHKLNDMSAFIPVRHAVQRALAEHAGITVRATVPVRQLPKTTSGKLQRFVLAQEFASGMHAQAIADVDALDPGTPAKAADNMLETRLLEICQGMLPGRALAVEDNLFEAGTSSLALAQIYERVDAAYPGMLEVTDFFDYPTVRTMAQHLGRRMAETA